MTSKSTPAAKAANPVRRPRETVAARRAREAAERTEAEQTFLLSRDLHWARLWARVLRTSLMFTEQHESFAAQNRDWLKRNCLVVNIWTQQFHMCPGFGKSQILVSPQALTLPIFEGLDSELMDIERSFDCFQEAKETERRRQQREEELRASGKAKLTPEEAKALGV